MKLLDAAERLPVHAHPDRAFAREAFDSPFGKTEAWIVLDTRNGEAEVWVGLREPVEPGRYLEWIAEQDVERLLHSLNRISVRPGDVVYVPAGVPHALGAGVLIAEFQEPTDFSFLCEWRGFPIRPEDSHLGLGWSAAVQALDLSAHEPQLALPPESRAFFSVSQRAEATGRFAVLLVVEGEGRIDGAPRVQVMPSPYLPPPSALGWKAIVRVLHCLGSGSGSLGGRTPAATSAWPSHSPAGTSVAFTPPKSNASPKRSSGTRRPTNARARPAIAGGHGRAPRRPRAVLPVRVHAAAAATPSTTRSASSRWLRLQGMVWAHVEATPMIGPPSRAGSIPIARKCVLEPGLAPGR